MTILVCTLTVASPFFTRSTWCKATTGAASRTARLGAARPTPCLEKRTQLTQALVVSFLCPYWSCSRCVLVEGSKRKKHHGIYPETFTAARTVHLKLTIVQDRSYWKPWSPDQPQVFSSSLCLGYYKRQAALMPALTLRLEKEGHPLCVATQGTFYRTKIPLLWNPCTYDAFLCFKRAKWFLQVVEKLKEGGGMGRFTIFVSLLEIYLEQVQRKDRFCFYSQGCLGRRV